MPLFGLFGGTLDGVFGVDTRQCITFWNEGAERILGLDAASSHGRPCYEVLDGIDEQGCVVCEKQCATYRDAVGRKLPPTRTTLVRTNAGIRISVSTTTFVLPSSWHARSLLVHVFRESYPTEFWHDTASVRTAGDALSDTPVRLTRREAQILQRFAYGQSTAAICAGLGISATTLRTHVQHILFKLGVHSRVEAVVSGIRNRLIHIRE